jgi:hypothetical protein
MSLFVVGVRTVEGCFFLLFQRRINSFFLGSEEQAARPVKVGTLIPCGRESKTFLLSFGLESALLRED